MISPFHRGLVAAGAMATVSVRETCTPAPTPVLFSVRLKHCSSGLPAGRSVDADGHLRNVEVQDPEPLRVLGWQKTTRNRSDSVPASQWHGRVSDGRHLTVVRAGDGWARRGGADARLVSRESQAGRGLRRGRSIPQ